MEGNPCFGHHGIRFRTPNGRQNTEARTPRSMDSWGFAKVWTARTSKSHFFLYFTINIYIDFFIKKVSIIENLPSNVSRREDAMKEADIVKAIMRFLKTLPNCFAWKEHVGMYGTAGIPDIIACIDGKFYGFEVKTDIGKPTKLQESTIRKINKAGGIAVVVRSVDEVKSILGY